MGNVSKHPHAKDDELTSVYWGFFTGGARNVHSDVIAALKDRDISHHVIYFYDILDRGSEGVQAASTDRNYQRLRNSGVTADSLSLEAFGGVDPYATIDHFSGAVEGASPLERAVRQLALAIDASPSDHLLCLKEQPANMLVLANRYLEEVLHKPVKPFIITLHRTDPGLQDPKSFAALQRIEHDPATRKYVAGYIAHGTSVARAYQQALGYRDGGGRFYTMPNGINLSNFHPRSEEEIADVIRERFPANSGITRESPMVLLAARNSPEKNPDLFLAAAWRFLQQHPDAHVVICGTGMTDEGLEKKIDATFADSGIEAGGFQALRARLHCIGKISAPEMASLCSMNTVIALTSPCLGEGDSLVLKEGMACGAVPVSTCTGDTPMTVGLQHAERYLLKDAPHGYVAGDCGILTSQHPDDIAAAWDEAFTKQAAMREAGAPRVPSFTHEKMADGYLTASHILMDRYRRPTDPTPRVDVRAHEFAVPRARVQGA